MPDVANARSAREILDTLPCGFVSFEDDGTIVGVNSTLASMLGYEPSELEGRHVETLLGVAMAYIFGLAVPYALAWLKRHQRTCR